jgi:hypothetical protein
MRNAVEVSGVREQVLETQLPSSLVVRGSVGNHSEAVSRIDGGPFESIGDITRHDLQRIIIEVKLS